MNILFHLAIPAYDLELTKDFYSNVVGCDLGRESDHAVILNFYTHQIVLHRVERMPEEQQGIYPRHFGLIFLDKSEFDGFVERLREKKVELTIPVKTRFPDTIVEHQSFFLKDPSANLLEFKCYTHQEAIFGAKDFKKVGETAR